MPRIPDASSFGARPDISPQKWSDAPDTSAPIKALAQIGETVTKIGEQIDQKDADTQYNEAMTRANQWHLDNIVGPDGIRKRKGELALNIMEDTRKSFEQTWSGIESSTTNPRTRRALGALKNARFASAMEETARWGMEQKKTVDDNAFVATVKTQQDMAAAKANDPIEIKRLLETQRTTVGQYWLNQGEKTATVEKKIHDAREETLGYVANKLLASNQASDLAIAKQFIVEHGKEMNSEQLLSLHGKITEKTNALDRMVFLTDTTTEIRRMERPGPSEMLERQIAMAESSGRHFDDNGKPTTSGKGATGLMQVMPDTGPEAAKLAGLKWDEELFNHKADGTPRDKEAETYNQMLGSAYLGMLVKKYAGDSVKAVAAYNAGHGYIDKVIAATDATGDKSPNAWLKNVYPETRVYVERVTAGLSSKNVAASTLGRSPLAEMTERVNAKYADDPIQRMQAMSEGRAMLELQKKAEKEQQSDTKSNIYQALRANNGQMTTDIAESLKTLEGNDAIEVDKYMKGEVEKNPDFNFYSDLLHDNQKLAATDLNAQRGRLSEAMLSKLSDLKGGNKGMLDAKEIYTNVLRGKDVDAFPTEKNASDKVYVNGQTFTKGELATRLYDEFTQLAGQNPTPEKAREIAGQLVADTHLAGKHFWNRNYDSPAYAVQPGETVIASNSDASLKQTYAPAIKATELTNNIPRVMRARILSTLAARGESQDEASVWQMYKGDYLKTGVPTEARDAAVTELKKRGVMVTSASIQTLYDNWLASKK